MLLYGYKGSDKMKKILKNKKISIFNIIIIAFIILYAIFGTDLIKDIEDNMASVSNITDREEDVSAKVSGDLEVYFLDVGQADSILIRVDGCNMLIDAGNNEDGKRLVDYFKTLNIEKFDYVVATHPHEDHIGGMDDIINNFEISNYLMPDVLTTTKTFEDVLDALEAKGLSYETPSIDSKLNLKDAIIDIVYVGEDSSDLNDSSIILKLTYGNNSFLFTGDATSKVEKEILDKDIQSEVLKVAHHGSNYSSSLEFIKKVNPKYAVIEVGENNTYNHPSSTTIEKLNDINAKIFRTDKDGTIIFTSDGEDISIKTINTDIDG